MNDLRSRLTQCFAVAFPDMDAEALSQVNAQTDEAWDSLASVTLMNLVQEEFGVEVAPEDAAELLSFDDYLQFLRGKGLA